MYTEDLFNTVESILAKWLGLMELKSFGDFVRVLNVDTNPDTGNDLANSGDDPMTASNRSRVGVGSTLIMRDVIKGPMTAASARVGMVFPRSGDASRTVSNRPSRNPNRVDGGSAVSISCGERSAMDVKNDTSVGTGRQLKRDLDSDSNVMSFAVAGGDKVFMMSGDEIVPSTGTSTDLGTRFRAPGDSENSPCRNWTRTFADKEPVAHGFPVVAVMSSTVLSDDGGRATNS